MTKRKPPEEHKPNWRPTIMTEETVNKLLEAFAKSYSDVQACIYANISKQTLYNYCEKYPEFFDRKEELKNTPSIKAKENVLEKINSKDIETSKRRLERKNKDEFATRTETTWKDWWPVEQITVFAIPDNTRSVEPETKTDIDNKKSNNK